MRDFQNAKAQLLLEQKRYSELETVALSMLSETPDDVISLLYLAEANLGLEKLDRAKNFIHQAIALDPENSLLHYTRARIAMNENDSNTAEQFLNTALSIDPEDPDFHTLLGIIAFSKNKWQDALHHIDKALAEDPEHLLALNFRSKILLKLKRPEEAYQTIEGALRHDPNHAFTHTSYGWNLLEQGQHREALEHFKTALQLDPMDDYAQEGMKAAMKASNPLYAGYLWYTFKMSNLTETHRWLVILGIYFLTRFMGKLWTTSPELAPFVFPVWLILVIFALSTWFMDAIGNLLLSFNRYGKYLLTHSELKAGYFGGAMLGLALLSGLLFWVTGIQALLVFSLAGMGLLLISERLFEKGKYQGIHIAVSALFVIAAIPAFTVALKTGQFASSWATVLVFLIVGYQIGSNILLNRGS
jgi:tetratricopeptide (TPR) repeat protein